MEKDETTVEETTFEETPEEEPELEEDNSTEESEPQEGDSTEEIAELKKKHAIEMRKLRKELKKTETKEKDTAPQSLTREEAKLYARGLEDDEVDRVIRIAKLDGISLTEAYNSDDFKSYKEKKERQAKREAAQLGAGKGASSNAGQKKSLNTPGLTAEEHKKLWAQS